MAFNLTKLPAPAYPSDPVAALHTYDAQRPDGITKEVVARAAALNLLKAAGHAASLVELHDLLDATVMAAVAAGAGIVNPVVKRLVSLGALAVQPGQSESDAKAALAGAAYDVAQRKQLTVTAIAPAAPPSSAAADAASSLFAPAGPAPGPHDLSGMDLLGPSFEPLRLVLTRTLLSARPDVYTAYRQIKDSGAPNAREEAYGYVFGLLAKLIEETHRSGGF
jgi:hypothetical protein